MAETRARIGVRLRRLREERGLTQRALARALDISPSYVNQLESNQRPVTAAVLLKLADTLDIDLTSSRPTPPTGWPPSSGTCSADASLSEHISQAEIHELAAAMPTVGHALVDLHRRYRHSLEITEAISARIDAGSPAAALAGQTAYEEVRDLFYSHRNYFPALDTAAENIAVASGLAPGAPFPALARRLADLHATSVTDLPETDAGQFKRRYDAGRRELALSPLLDDGQRAFQAAAHLASIELTEHIEAVVGAAGLSDDETRQLARTGLANYAAGAMILPYRAFRDAPSSSATTSACWAAASGSATRPSRTASARCSAPGPRRAVLLRPGRPGRQRLQAPVRHRLPLLPGRRLLPALERLRGLRSPQAEIQTQLAQMPDGRRYLWIARTVTQHSGSFRDPGQDLRHRPGLRHSGTRPGSSTPTTSTSTTRPRSPPSAPAASSATATPARSAPSRPSASRSTPARSTRGSRPTAPGPAEVIPGRPGRGRAGRRPVPGPSPAQVVNRRPSHLASALDPVRRRTLRRGAVRQQPPRPLPGKEAGWVPLRLSAWSASRWTGRCPRCRRCAWSAVTRTRRR